MKSIDTFKERHPRATRLLSGPAVAVSRYLLAALFIFSGASKAIDPFGLSVKLGEYLSAFGLDALQVLAGVGSILLPTFEMMVGLMLLGGLSRRVTSWLTFLCMSFFTLLTLWLAISNPVSDCGCFGDLIHLTNWGTFFKNLIFWPLSALLFVTRNSQRQFNPSPLRSIVTYAVLLAASLGLTLYCNSTLPPIDPTPFRVGVNIPHAMTVHENEAQTILVYRDKQDGSLHDFSIEDTTWYDSSRWEYVDTRTVGQSTVPEIKAVPMFDGNIERSAEILQRKGYTLIFVINDYDPTYEPQMFALSAYIHAYSGRAVALSANDLPASLAENGIEPMGSDYTILHTMIQHRKGGALLLHDGTILGKWSMNRLPRWQEDDHDPLNHILTAAGTAHEQLLIALFLLAVGVIAVCIVRTPEWR